MPWVVAGAKMHPSEWNKKWLFWQVAAPILGPILISAIAVIFWASIDSMFTMKWDVILDVSPWALTFFIGTVIGATGGAALGRAIGSRSSHSSEVSEGKSANSAG